MKKIAIINQRYGLEVNGGSEYYTRLLAEKLARSYRVDILTTKALSYRDWSNYYLKTQENLNGVHVRRFPVKLKRLEKVQRILGKLIRDGKINSQWISEQWVKCQGPYAPDLVDYISVHADDYDAFIFVTYLYYPTVFGLPKVRDKAVFIPTAHDELYIYFRCYRELFHMPKAILYLTEEERNFVHRQFKNQEIPSVVAGVGVDLPEDIDNRRFLEKYQIRTPYLVYAGRIDTAKKCDQMFEYFQKYHATHSNISLVVMGKEYMKVPAAEGIYYIGFVDEQEKFDAISGAAALWLPSAFESLSIAVLEAMALAVPVLVNGECEVLKGHCVKSGGGVYYTRYEDCAAQLDHILIDDSYRNDLSVHAKQYIEANYSWESIMNTIRDIIEKVSS